jgi:thiosulfate reductase cytochrome b subunit
MWYCVVSRNGVQVVTMCLSGSRHWSSQLLRLLRAKAFCVLVGWLGIGQYRGSALVSATSSL